MAADDGSAFPNRKTHRSLAISDLIGLVAVFALAFSAKQGHVDLMLAPIVLAPVILIKRGRLRDLPGRPSGSSWRSRRERHQGCSRNESRLNPRSGDRDRMPSSVRDVKRSRLINHDARIRECRSCHLRGYLDEIESVPIVRDPEPDALMPRILLIGQAPSLRATITDRPFAGVAGDKLRAWFEQGGIAREDFWKKIHFAAITRCYPGRLPGAKGDRVPSAEEQALCRHWMDGTMAILKPDIVLLLGLLAIRTYLGPVASLSAIVGTAEVRHRVRFLPLPHPSGVSRWLNERENVEAVGRSMTILKDWVDELGI